MPEATHRHAAARAAIGIAHLAAFMGIWVLVALITRGNPVHWYLAGGAGMHLLLLIALAQAVVGTWLGFRHLEAPLPTSSHFALPVTAVLTGLGASTLGVDRAFDALFAAPPDVKLQTLTAALAAGELPQQLGSLIGGFGCASVAVTAAVVAALNRDPETRSRAPFAIAALGLLGAIITATLFHFRYPQDVDTTLLVWLATVVFGGSLALAAATPGVRTLLQRKNRGAPAVGFSLGVLVAVAAIGTVLLQGLATAAHGRIEALQATGMAPLDMATILIASGASATRLGNQMTVAFTLAATIPAAVVLWWARTGLLPWLRDRFLWAMLTIAMVAAAAAVHGRFRAGLEKRVQAATADLRPHTPDGLALAGSTSDARYVSGAGQVIVLRGDTASLPDRVVGAIDDLSTIDQLAEVLQPAANPDTNPEDLAAHLVTAAALVPPDCPEPILEPFALVVDGTIPAAEILRFTANMRARGACRMRLMVRPRHLLESPDLIAQRDAMWRELRGSGMLAALFEAAANDWYFVYAYLTTKVPEATDDVTPIILRVEDEAVRVTVPGTPDNVIAATRRGRVDRDALALELEDLKATFPAERRVYVDHVGDASLQDIVDMLDAARVEVEFEDDTVGTFDKVVFVTGEVPAAPADTPGQEPTP